MLAALLVLAGPGDPGRARSRSRPPAFLAIPVEALLGVVVAARRFRPGRAGSRRSSPARCARPADHREAARPRLRLRARPAVRPAVRDWPLLRAGQEFLAESFGRTRRAAAAAIGVGLLAVALPVLMALAVRRLSRVVPATGRSSPGGPCWRSATVWVVLAAFGVHLVPGVPIAAWNTSAAAYDHATQLRADLADRAAFARESAVDAYRDTPGDQTADRAARQGRHRRVRGELRAGRARGPADRPAGRRGPGRRRPRGWRTAGSRARSAFLTSPTAGGGELARARDAAVRPVGRQPAALPGASPAATGSRSRGAFGRAGWRTVDVHARPTSGTGRRARCTATTGSTTRATSATRARASASRTMPDQYTLAAFHRAERATPGHPPVMAEFDMVSSHAPWEPVPAARRLGRDRRRLGTRRPGRRGRLTDEVFEREIDRVRDDFARSIAYSLRTLVSYVETYGDDNLVLVLLGDHQPAADHHRQPAPGRRCRSPSSRATRPSWTASPAGAGRTACDRIRGRRSGRWTRSATGSSPRSDLSDDARTRRPSDPAAGIRRAAGSARPPRASVR